MKLFRDRDKLSHRYVPSHLPHREEQVDLLFSLFEDAISGGGPKYMRIVQLIGDVGSGKTSSSLLFCRNFSRIGKERLGVDIRYLYLNLKIEGLTPFLIYRALLERAGFRATRSVSAEELLKYFVKRLEGDDRLFMIVLDEVDYYVRCSKAPGIIYDLTRLYELSYRGPSKIIGIVFIARSPEWRKSLGRAEASSVGALTIVYPPYNLEQVYDILRFRASEAFCPGAVEDSALEYIAEVTSSYKGGDIRFALDILFYGGVLAEREGADRVRVSHVRRVINSYEREHGLFTEADFSELDKYDALLLLACIKALEDKKRAHVSFSELRNYAYLLFEEESLKPLRDTELESRVQRLVDIGAMELKGLTKISVNPAMDEERLNRLISS